MSAMTWNEAVKAAERWAETVPVPPVGPIGMADVCRLATLDRYYHDALDRWAEDLIRQASDLSVPTTR